MFSYIKYRLREFVYGGSKIKIPRNALVLEVASGGKPYWRSNILVDKFIVDNSERDEGETGAIIDRDFVVADVTRLPFADKAFDFVIARHVLEHLPAPESFFKELQRVGKAGYIETPSSLAENLYGWPFHIWEVDVKDAGLTLVPKQKDINKQLKKLTKFFDADKNLAEFSREHRNVFYTGYYWENFIKYKVQYPQAAVIKEIESTNTDLTSFRLAEYRKKYRSKTRLKIFFNTWHRKLFGAKAFNLVDMLRCIHCASQLRVDSNSNHLVCAGCRKIFDYIDRIPVVL